MKFIGIKRIGLRTQEATFSKSNSQFKVTLGWSTDNKRHEIEKVHCENESVLIEILKSIKYKTNVFKKISNLIRNNIVDFETSIDSVVLLDSGEIEVTIEALSRKYKVILGSLEYRSENHKIIDIENNIQLTNAEINLGNFFENKLINDAIYQAELELIGGKKRELALMSFAVKKRVHSFRQTSSKDLSEQSPFMEDATTKKRANYALTCLDENLNIIGFVSKYAGLFENTRECFVALTALQIETMRI